MENEGDRSFELRSEETRSIIGEIPSVLIRYGITMLGIGLLCLFCIAYFMPYKQAFTGSAIVDKVFTPTVDSVDVILLLHFEYKRPYQIKNSYIVLLPSNKHYIKGRLLTLSAVRDTLDRQYTKPSIFVSLYLLETYSKRYQETFER